MADDEYDDLEKEMKRGEKKGGKKAPQASQAKPTPPPLPSDSPMRQELVDDAKLGGVQTLPDEPSPTKDEETRRGEMLAEAANFHEMLTQLCTDFSGFLSSKVDRNAQLSAFQRAWLGSAGFHLHRAVDHLEVAMKGKGK